MFKFENVRYCMWRNAYSPRPLLAGTISFGDAFEWTTRRLSPAVLSVFKEKLSGAVPESGHLAAPDFVASLAQHIQLLGDITTADWGVGWRDNAKRTADIFFSCRDPVVGSQSLSLAAQIADRPANSDLSRDRLSVPMHVMFDSSGKAPGYAAAVTVTDAIKVAGKRICVITLPGNRPDWAFAEAAAALAGHFDHYICFEREEYRRGRKPGEIPARLADALIAAGVTPSAVFLAGPHKDAAKRVAEQATEQDFVVVFATDSPATVEEYRSVLRRIRAPE